MGSDSPGIEAPRSCELLVERRGDGGEAQCSWLPVPLAMYQAHIPLADVFSTALSSHTGANVLDGCSSGAPSARVTWCCRGAGSQGGLRGLFMPLPVSRLCGANRWGSGLPACLGLGQLSWGKVGLRAALPPAASVITLRDLWRQEGDVFSCHAV